MINLSGQHWHFIGVGGIGMSALADMAARFGASVSGCDREAGPATEALGKRGVAVRVGHDAKHVAAADVVVYSSAIPESHPERVAAGGRGIRRGELLAKFMGEAETSVGVCGTHGKTTTTWLLGHLLVESGFDPALYVGGFVAALPAGNYRLGQGPFVAELDESDGSFLMPRLDAAVVTNIESDHLSHYGDFSALRGAFRQYARGVAESGLLVAGIDDPEAEALYDSHSGKKLSFGMGEKAAVRPLSTRVESGQRVFRLSRRGEDLGEFRLSLPGEHNLKNALAALGTALELGADPEALRSALPCARSVGRRLEALGEVSGTPIYSDYAHHPTEVAATIRAVREIAGGKVLVAFQPHLFSRTRDYADDFARALSLADAVVLLDVYPAREDPIPGVDSSLLASGMGGIRPGIDVSGPFSVDAVGDEIARRAADFSVVVMMGAGSIDQAARRLVGREG
ncbi:MAG: UDP-N-acetylmuramate--L-alanine ligase [Planctomycetota bacterium]|nr:UDP-N-acetylmuramate--L-alanine ligase [Planctomycetota bacterium]